MSDEDYNAFIGVLTAVFTYYGKEISQPQIEIYWSGLRGYDLAVIKDALGRHAKNPDTGQFLPKIADVERMLGGSTQDAALLAWTKVEAAVKGAGSWYSVAFDDGLIHRVIEEMGGWIVLCMVTSKEWPFRQNEFVARYRAYRVRKETPPHPARLVGTIEGTNRAKGWETPDRDCLKLIGDPVRARAVITSGQETRLLQITAGAAAERAVAAIEEKR